LTDQLNAVRSHSTEDGSENDRLAGGAAGV
jgi:hypothetical protein